MAERARRHRLIAAGCVLVASGAAVLWLTLDRPSLSEMVELARGNALLRSSETEVLNALVTAGVAPTYSYYNNPQLVRSTAGMLISGDGSEAAGVYFRYQLDPTLRYRLTMTGSSVAGTPVLRTRSGNADPVYRPPMEGTDHLSLSGVSTYELLLYSDQAFGYRLDQISLRPCSDCKVDADITDLILSASGVAEQIRDEPLEGARAILDWVANAGDYALSSSIHEETDARVARGSAADIYYEVFLPDAGGVYCGGYAIFLNKVLRLLGYNSFTMNYGDLADDLTHVTVVVPIQRDESSQASPKVGNSWDFYIFDPTFNGIYVDAQTGAQLPFQKMLELIAAGQEASIRVDERPLDQREFLALPDDRGQCPELIEEGGRYLVCAYPGFGIEQYLADWDQRLRRNGYSTGVGGLFELMFARVFSVEPSPAPGAREEFVTLLGEFGIPVGRD